MVVTRRELELAIAIIELLGGHLQQRKTNLLDPLY